MRGLIVDVHRTGAVAALLLACAAVPALAQDGEPVEGPPAPPSYSCDTSGLELQSHNLRQGQINLPVTCQFSDDRGRQTFIAPEKVTGTLTVSAGVRRKLGLRSTRLTAGTFSGPKMTTSGHAYAHFWRKLSSGVRAKLERVAQLPFRAELQVTVRDGVKLAVKGSADATTLPDFGGYCKLFGRMRYACDGL